MDIANNVLQQYLGNVYWIGGSACGGKTTMAQLLAKRHGLCYYNADNMYKQHRKLAITDEQPAMCQYFASAETYFLRPIEEYANWLDAINREQLSMIVCDLIKLSSERPIIIEGHFAPQWLKPLTDSRKAIFLCAEADIIRQDYFAREDKAAMLAAIYQLADPVSTLNHVLDVTVELTRRHLTAARGSGLRYLVRNAHSTIENTLEIIEQHFGLG